MLVDGPTEHETSVLGNHLRYLEQLVADGVVLMAGRTLTTDERSFGLVMVVAPSDAAAAALMRNDPAVKRGVMSAELFPYRVALWSPQGPA